jgi:hypothetical protein
MHASCEVRMHVPFGRQHAPGAGGHTVFPHVVPGPRQIPCSPAQAAWVSTEQVPLGRQQAPVGAGQLAVAHAVPLPR